VGVEEIMGENVFVLRFLRCCDKSWPAGAEIGERVFVQGYDGEPATENQVIKKKMLDAIFPDLKTNEEGVATYRYKGVPLSTSAGSCKSSLLNAPIA
jgi:hypothetical protein